MVLDDDILEVIDCLLKLSVSDRVSLTEIGNYDFFTSPRFRS